ncbi:acetyl-CoA C-acyltransferase [Bacillus shivajii]|uniref:thiolase family protein n=1 Tax=Bacillus shivajii TaxID=1983719 RepID=UPI001CF97FFB|nr:acetyl-CoA C-acyltransferase [Bacillus shivajii]UCZ52748.1 acetyl-CoA C-acyltransferase [Bacillus shivajii]
MSEAVIVSAVRTPIGRHGGVLSSIRPDDLAAIAIKEAVDKANIDPELIEDVILGCANQAGEDNRNVARMGLLLAQLPETVGGVTVNRLCGSGMEAIIQAARAIKSDEGDVFVVGGVESMSRAPWVMPKPDSSFPRGHSEMFDTTLGWRFINPKMNEIFPIEALGETAENVAEKYRVSRQTQDEFAYESQRKYSLANENNIWKDEIIKVPVKTKQGETVLISEDEHPRPNVTVGKLSKLKPVFRSGGTVTAGNSSGLNDGASALVVMSETKAEELGLEPLAKVVTGAVAGVSPSYMGIGPVPSSIKALKQAGWSIDELGIVEVNEAFAAQAVASIQELNIEMSKVNVNGGAIALGHPLGCSGARVITTMVHEMRRREAKKGLATMCIGVGQGISLCVESL